MPFFTSNFWLWGLGVWRIEISGAGSRSRSKFWILWRRCLVVTQKCHLSHKRLHIGSNFWHLRRQMLTVSLCKGGCKKTYTHLPPSGGGYRQNNAQAWNPLSLSLSLSGCLSSSLGSLQCIPGSEIRQNRPSSLQPGRPVKTG